MSQFWRDWLGAWETVEFEYELVDAGDRVVALIDQRMRGRSTDIEVPLGKYAQVWTFRDGLVVHWKLVRQPGGGARGRRSSWLSASRM